MRHSTFEKTTTKSRNLKLIEWKASRSFCQVYYFLSRDWLVKITSYLTRKQQKALRGMSKTYKDIPLGFFINIFYLIRLQSKSYLVKSL